MLNLVPKIDLINSIFFLIFKGVAYGNLGKYEVAIMCYDRALSINPNNDETHNNKGS